MRTLTIAAAAVVLAAFTTPVVAQDHTPHGAQAAPVVQAFEHYEGVRAALAADNLADATPHAKQLAASVEPVGGADGKKHAEALAAATTIEDARTHFGKLSTILVPKFQAAKIEGAHAFTCGMKEQAWMQRGKRVENPYYGKAMLTCGSPLTPKDK